MEKTGQEKVEYMMAPKEPWIDTRLNKKEMDFLWTAISEENKKDISSTLAGNIFKSELIIDKDNWFYETVLKKLTEKMFYDDWDNYRKYVVDKEEIMNFKECDEKPEFKMNKFWVNYMKQYEFNPLHGHGGLFSFVIFMKIPTHWKEQHALPKSANSNSPIASDFQFLLPGKEVVEFINYPLSPVDEGRMLFFPAWLQHGVYPFYECEEERITISGNIDFWKEEHIADVPVSGVPQNFQPEQIKQKIMQMEEQIELFKIQLEEKEAQGGVYDG